MKRNEELQQQLWEFVYDLLSDEEARALTALIEADVETARVYAEVKQQSELVASAMRVELPKMDWRAPAQGTGSAPVHPDHLVPAMPVRRRARGWMAGNWLAAAAAAALLLVIGGVQINRRLIAPRVELVAVAGPVVHTTVYGPAQLAARMSNSFTVVTRDLEQSPVATDVLAVVRDPNQAERWQARGQTSADGVWHVSIPAEFAQDNFQLAVNRAGAPAAEAVALPLTTGRPALVTHVATDRRVYQPGDTVYARSLTLVRPGGADAGEIEADFKLIEVAESALLPGSEMQVQTVQGVGSFAHDLPADTAAGRYAVVVHSPGQEFAEVTREFLVRRDGSPTLDLRLDFARPVYRATERVVVDIAATRPGGEPVVAPLTVNATLDGQPIFSAQGQTSVDGSFQAQFDLPTEIATGRGVIEVVLQDGQESRREEVAIPIDVPMVAIDFFPEGGRVVPRVANRVYFEARTPQGRPIPARGELVDDQQRSVAVLETGSGMAAGRGVLELTPGEAQRYRVQLREPRDVTVRGELVVDRGPHIATLNAGKGVFAPRAPIVFDVLSTVEARTLVAVVACQGVEVGQMVFQTRALQPTRVTVPVSDEASGVLRVTLFDFDEPSPRAIAERLVYRQPSGELQVVAAPTQNLIAGKTAQLELQVLREDGEPARAVVGAAVRVQDDEQVEAGRPSLLADFLLAAELGRLEDGGLEPSLLVDGPDSERALDLLLGTRGWRRIDDVPAAELASMPLGAQREFFAQGQVPATAAILPPRVADNSAMMLARSVDRHSATADLADNLLPLAGRWLCALALLAVIVVLALAVGRLARLWAWLPSLGVALASLVVGLFWMGVEPPGWPSGPPVRSVAQSDVPREVPSSVASKVLDSAAASADAALAAAPAPGAVTPDALASGLRADVPAAQLSDLGMAPEPALDMKTESAGAAQEEHLYALEGKSLGGFGGGEPRRRAAAGAGRLAAGWGDAGYQDGTAPTPDRALRFAPERDARGLRRGDGERGGQGPAAVLAGGGGGAAAAPAATALDQERPDAPAPATTNAPAGAAPAPSGLAQPQIRRYAHRLADYSRNVPERRPETLFWDPLLLTDSQGRLALRFDVPAAVQRWEVTAFANGERRLGELAGPLPIQSPLDVKVALPKAINAGDQLQALVELTNNTDEPLDSQMTFSDGTSTVLVQQQAAVPDLRVDANSIARQQVPLEALPRGGNSRVQVQAVAGKEVAEWKGEVRVEPPDYPVVQAFAGWLRGSQEVSFARPFPPRASTMQITLRAYPSLSAEILDVARGVDGSWQLGSPTEQLAARAVLAWMQHQRVAHPELTGKLKWFASTVGFDENRRLEEQLMRRLPTTGGLLSFGPLYRHWQRAEMQSAVAPRGEPELSEAESLDSYSLALAARAATLDRLPTARELGEQLVTRQAADGSLDCVETASGRGGRTPRIETTALAILSWTGDESFAAPRGTALRWLRTQRIGAGDFGAGDANALATLALVQDTSRPRLADAETTVVLRGGERELAAASIPAGSGRPLTWSGEIDVTPEQPLTFELRGPQERDIPFVVGLTYQTDQPPSHPAAPVRIQTELSQSVVRLGERLALRVRLEGVAPPAVVVRVGLPAGCAPDLNAMPAGSEMDGNELLLRLDSPFREPRDWVRSEDVLEFTLPMTAEFAGRFTSSASRAYPGHAPELAHWAAPVTVTVNE